MRPARYSEGPRLKLTEEGIPVKEDTMQCEICGGQCLDPHTTDVDLEKVLDGADDCPFHGVECEAVEFSYSKYGLVSVVYDCGAVGPGSVDEERAVNATHSRRYDRWRTMKRGNQ